MKRQFEKVLNDFQPGLLKSLLALYDDTSDNDVQVIVTLSPRKKSTFPYYILCAGRYQVKICRKRQATQRKVRSKV